MENSSVVENKPQEASEAPATVVSTTAETKAAEEDSLFTDNATIPKVDEDVSTQNPMAEFMLGEPQASPNGGELTRVGGPVAGIEYRSSTHPYKVFVGGVSPVASEHDLFNFFERRIGTVAHLTLALDTLRPERYHKGYGFVVFASQALRDKCLESSKYSFMDRELEVKHVESNRSRPATGPIGSAGSTSNEVPDSQKLFVAIKGGATNQGILDVDELTNHFNHYGTVKRVVIVKDRVTGANKGFGFVYFTTPEAPQIAIGAGKEHMLGNLRVEIKPFSTLGSSNMPPAPMYGVPGGPPPPGYGGPYGMPYGGYGVPPGYGMPPPGYSPYPGAHPGMHHHSAPPSYAPAGGPSTGGAPGAHSQGIPQGGPNAPHGQTHPMHAQSSAMHGQSPTMHGQTATMHGQVPSLHGQYHPTQGPGSGPTAHGPGGRPVTGGTGGPTGGYGMYNQR